MSWNSFRARKEWDKFDSSVRAQFGRKLRERVEHPRVPAARLRELPDCYKIKLRRAGYRLIYRGYDDRIVVHVIAVGRRDRDEVYKAAAGRID